MKSSTGFKPRLEVLEERMLLSTLFVDDDRVQCPEADYTDLGTAIFFANPGDTIRVCPGYYGGDIHVFRDNLQILAAGPALDQRTGDTTREAVVSNGSFAGLYVTANGARIEGFTIQDNDFGIVTESVTGTRIEKNLVRSNNSVGIALFGGSDNFVANNSVERHFEGIALYGENHSVVANNQATNNTFGIAVHGGDHNFVVNNQVTGGGYGIYLNHTTHNVVAFNRTTTFGNGIHLADADNNLLVRNQSLNNGRHGIYLDSLSTGNLLVRNIALGNLEHDCHDDSVGTGTAGTANFWRRNTGRTENRLGLCLPPEDGDDDDDDGDDN